jgi:hypothetical protein
VDLIVLGHGSAETLQLHGEDLTDQEIRGLRTDAQARGVQTLTLRTVYMCNCFGSTVNDAWVAIGAKAVGRVSSERSDARTHDDVLRPRVRRGEGRRSGGDRRVHATIPWYIVIYPPVPHITYSIVDIPYPCPTWNDPFRFCHQEIQIPTGVNFTPNPKVLETELLVEGEASVRF